MKKLKFEKYYHKKTEKTKKCKKSIDNNKYIWYIKRAFERGRQTPRRKTNQSLKKLTKHHCIESEKFVEKCNFFKKTIDLFKYIWYIKNVADKTIEYWRCWKWSLKTEQNVNSFEIS